MKMTHIALIWAGIILATAFYTSYIGLSEAASWGLTMGQVGAAWASIEGNRRNRRRCNKVCL